MTKSNTFFIILAGVILGILLIVPSVILKNCPLKLISDPAPGKCPLYQDQNEDNICDLSQEILGASTEELLSRDSVIKQILNFEVILVFVILILASISLFIRRFLWLRFFTLAFGLIYLGFFKGPALCPILSFQNLFLLKSRIVIGLSAFIVFLLPIIFSLILGRVFCGWLCPIGAFQEFVFKIREILRKYLNIKWKIKIHPLWQRIIDCRLHYIKYIILLGIILGVVIGKRSILCGFDPWGALFGFFKTPASWVMLGIFTLLSVFIFRPWCKYICPYGALLSILSRISIFRIQIDKKKCNQCRICERLCHKKAIDGNHIDQAECNRCGEYLNKCPRKAISLK